MSPKQLADQCIANATPFLGALSDSVVEKLAKAGVAEWLYQQDDDTNPAALIGTANEATRLILLHSWND